MKYKFNQARLETLPESAVETMTMSLTPKGYKMEVFWVRHSGNFGSRWVNDKGGDICLYLRTSKGEDGIITGSLANDDGIISEIEITPDSEEFKMMVGLGIYTAAEQNT
jgi:hypothetical protein